MKRYAIPLLLLAAGCMAPAPAVPPAPPAPVPSVGPRASAPASYVAPDFGTLPPATAAGYWVRQAPDAEPSPPTPAPTATPWAPFSGSPIDAQLALDAPIDVALGEPFALPDLLAPASGAAVTRLPDGRYAATAPGRLTFLPTSGTGHTAPVVGAARGPNAGARFGIPGVPQPPALGPDQAMVIRTTEAWRAFWHDRAPQASPPPIDFAASAVVIATLRLRDDQAAPVLTHVDAAVHLVVPDHPGRGQTPWGRVVTAYFQTGPLEAGLPVRVDRRDAPPADLPQMPPDGRSPLPTPEATAPPPEDDGPATRYPCLPSWAGTAMRGPIGISPYWVVGPGQPGTPPPADVLVARADTAIGLIAYGRSTPDFAHPTEGPYYAEDAPSMASPPPLPLRFPGDWENVVGARIHSGPGHQVVWAAAGGPGATTYAYAVLAFVAAPAPAIAFRFADGGAATKADPGGVFRDEAAFAAWWDAFVGRPGRPAIDWATRDAVAFVDDRTAWSEGTPVLTHVADGEVSVVIPGYQGIGPLRRVRRVRLFQTGKLPAGAKLVVHSLERDAPCAERSPR